MVGGLGVEAVLCFVAALNLDLAVVDDVVGRVGLILVVVFVVRDGDESGLEGLKRERVGDGARVVVALILGVDGLFRRRLFVCDLKNSSIALLDSSST